MNKDVITFQLSKNKIILLLIGAIVFVFLGLLLFLNAERVSNGTFLRTPFQVKFWGVLSVVFFGLAAIYFIIKIFDNKQGLLLDNQGITDNSSAITIGFVDWKEVHYIEIINIMGQEMIAIHLKDENQYLLKVKNPIKKWLLKTNSQYFGGMMNISANALNASTDELYKSINKYFQKYKEIISAEELAEYKNNSNTETYDE